jgi:hypothetical protein
MTDPVDQQAIVRYISETFDGVDVQQPTAGPGAGDTFFIYDPGRNLEPKHQLPFATIVTKDYGEFDRASDLDRPGVFRLNVGVSRDTFRSLFPADQSGYDFAALGTLLPHPVYAPQSFVCVLNPSADTFTHVVQPLLAEAYGIVARRHPRQAETDSKIS